jgi:hypothetical protein
MLGEAFVVLIIEGNILFAVFEGAYDPVFVVVFVQDTFQAEAVGEVLGVLGFTAGKVAFGEAEVIYGIEQVRFTGAVASGNAYDTFVESEGFPGVIFELDK